MARISTEEFIDLEMVAEKIKWWFDVRSWETRSFELAGSHYIKARKSGLWRAAVAADRALQVGVHHGREGGTYVEVKQGDWTTNIVSNAVWFIFTGGLNLAISGWSFVLQKQLEGFIREILEEAQGADEGTTMPAQEADGDSSVWRDLSRRVSEGAAGDPRALWDKLRTLPQRSTASPSSWWDQWRTLEEYSADRDYWGKKIPAKKLLVAQQAHGLEGGDVFYLSCFSRSGKQSILATDRGISVKRGKLPALFLPWDSVYDLTIDDKDKMVRLKSSGKTYCFPLYQGAYHEKFRDLLVELSQSTDCSFEQSMNSIREKIAEARGFSGEDRDERVLEEIVALCDELLRRCEEADCETEYCREGYLKIEDPDRREIAFYRALALWKRGEVEQARADLLPLVQQRERMPNELFVDACEVLSEICLAGGQSHYSLVYLEKAKAVGGPDTQRRAIEALHQLRERRADCLTREPVENRQIIFCTDEIPRDITEQFCFAGQQALQATGWRFGAGHPRPGVFYVCHPLRPSCYYPIEEFHDSLFADKCQELVYLLESIGARYIQVEAGQGFQQDELSAVSRAMGGSVGIVASLPAEGSVEGSSAQRLERSSQTKQATLQTYELHPPTRPDLPHDLVWYPYEPDWKRLSKLALEGRLKEHTFEVRYQEDFSINEKKVRQIKGGLNVFLLGGGNIHWSEELDNKLQQRRSTALRVKAVFEPSADLGSQMLPSGR